jgi:hypothetical protein
VAPLPNPAKRHTAKSWAPSATSSTASIAAPQASLFLASNTHAKHTRETHTRNTHAKHTRETHTRNTHAKHTRETHTRNTHANVRAPSFSPNLKSGAPTVAESAIPPLRRLTCL